MTPDRIGKFADLRIRVISSMAAASVALACVWFGGLPMVALAGIAAVVMTIELRAIIEHSGNGPGWDAPLYPVAVGGGAAALVFWSAHAGLFIMGAVLVAAVFVDCRQRRAGEGQRRPTPLQSGLAIGPWLALAAGGFVLEWFEVALVGLILAILSIVFTTLEPGYRRRRTAMALGSLYIGAAAIGAIWLRDAEPFGFLAILWAGLVVIAADVGGYFAGRLAGGPKLWPRVSPKKTWSGLGGGVLLAALVGFFFSWATTGTYFGQVCTVSALAALLSQGGDLAESALKRQFGVKDSGKMMPGHGGLLDRLDGHMAAILVAAAVTYWRGEAVFIW